MVISAHLTPQAPPRNFSTVNAAGLVLPLLPGFFLQSTLLRSPPIPPLCICAVGPSISPVPSTSTVQISPPFGLPTGLSLPAAFVISAQMPYLTSVCLAISTLISSLPTASVIHAQCSGFVIHAQCSGFVIHAPSHTAFIIPPAYRSPAPLDKCYVTTEHRACGGEGARAG
ncbi:hypothetical protein DFH29DRAFT_1007721 [Suillus ampliporus]|nr:hypothetical protein DFH29DRAFT_1007721 [Suillus ampliporus]